MTECAIENSYLGILVTLGAVFLGWLLATLQYCRRSPGEKRLDRDIEEAGKRLLAADRARTG